MNNYGIYFCLMVLVTTISVLIILGLKKIAQNHLSITWQYKIDWLILFLFFLPFLPVYLFDFFKFSSTLPTILSNQTDLGSEIGANSTTGILGEEAWLGDFYTSVNRIDFNQIGFVVLGIVLLGIFILSILLIFNQKNRLFKESLKIVEDTEIHHLFENCKNKVNLRKRVSLRSSFLVDSPMAFGFLRTYVVIPSNPCGVVSEESLGFAFLHELTHCKNGDLFVAKATSFLRVLCWYNPVMYHALAVINLERELACDETVLAKLSANNRLAYGHALLNFINNVQGGASISSGVAFGGTKSQIKARIEAIVGFVEDSAKLKRKSFLIFLFLTASILFQIQIASGMILVDDDVQNQHLIEEKLTSRDFSQYFRQHNGSLVLYDLVDDHYQIYNKKESRKRISPVSTVKIFSALMAMDEDLITPNNSHISWDGTKYPYPDWEKDQDLRTAMDASVSWYFQSLDQLIGTIDLETYYEKLGYGNSDLSGGVESYWEESSLKISPFEQVELLTNLYLNDTIFKEDHVDYVKEVLFLSENSGSRLSGKTGTGAINGKTVNGWFIGYVERVDKVTVFATNIQGKDGANGKTAREITLEILKDLNIYG